MDAINNYIDSFLFRFNEVRAAMDKTLGIEFHHVDGWHLLFDFILMMIIMYFYSRSNITEWLYRYDTNGRYSMLFLQTFLFVLIYLTGGEKALVQFLFLIILGFAFYYIVLRNKQYEWLKELILKLF